MALQDIPRFLEAAYSTFYYRLFHTALWTGMRLSEFLGVRWCDVYLELGYQSMIQSLYKRNGVCQMVQPKSKHSWRSIAVPPMLTGLFQQHRIQQEADRLLLGLPLKETDLIFAHPDGSPLDPSTVGHNFSRILEKAGIPHICFHDLRHIHATLLLEADVHPKIVQERLGYSSIAVTIDTYSHVVPGLQEMAARRIEVAIGDEALKILVDDIAGGSMLADVDKMLAKKGNSSVSRTGLEPVTC